MSNPGKSPVTPKRLKQAVLSFKTIAPDENKRKRLNNDNTPEQNIKIPRISLQRLSSDGIQELGATVSGNELRHFLDSSSSVCDASRINAHECDTSEIKEKECDNPESEKHAHECDLTDTKTQEYDASNMEALESDTCEIDSIPGKEITSSKTLFFNANQNIKGENLISSQPKIEADPSLNDCNSENTNVGSQSQPEIYYTPEDCKSEEIETNFPSEYCDAIKMEVSSLSELDSSSGDGKSDKVEVGSQPSPDRVFPPPEDMNSPNLKSEEFVNLSASSEQNSESITPIICKTPTAGNVKKKTLTPKQQDRENKRQEERRQKEEEKRKIAEEKIRAKNEEKRKKEEERKRKEEEENRIKEEKRKLKEEEKRQKEEEKRKREEEKQKKEEERLRLKEEEQLQQLLKEEEKISKKLQEEKSLEKSKALLTSFLRVKPKAVPEKMDMCVSQESANSNNDTGSNFMPFQLKKGMKLAITNRATLNEGQLQTLDTILAGNCSGQQMELYLSQLKSPSYKVGSCPNTEYNADENDDAIIDENDGEVVIKKEDLKFGKYRWKLIQFEENRRPAYWGTWRKGSKYVTGRKPFARDKDLLDYEFDSDEEWEDETEGESLAGSDEDKESDDDYEVDNSFFVPHGYLSDEEQDADTEDLVPPEEQGVRLKQLEEKFKSEHSQKTHKLKPRIYYVSTKCDSSNKASIALSKLLTFSAICEPNLLEQPIKIDFGSSRSAASSPTDPNKSSSKNKLTEFPDALVADLIKLAHGNKNIRSIVDEFVDFCRKLDTPVRLSKVCVERKVKEISTYTRPTHDENAFSYGYCWYVNDDIRAKHGLENLSYSNNNSQSSSKANVQCTPTSLLGFAVTIPPFSVSPSTQVQPPPLPPTSSIVTPPPQPRNKTSILNFATVLTPKITSVNREEPVNRSYLKEVSEAKVILENFKEIPGVEKLGNVASKFDVVEKIPEQKSQSKVATSNVPVPSPSTPAVPVVKKRVALTRVG